MNQLPASFLKRMENRLSSDEFPLFQSAYEAAIPQSIRLNSKKPLSQFEELTTIQWCPLGKILNEKKKFITDPLWHAGAYYVQEPSSMILYEVFEQLYPNDKPQRALDLCAAPGGKSTLLQSLLDEKSVLIANEVIKSRAQILKQNHIRLGLSENIIITQNDPKKFTALDEFFDYIQIDAPCSGEGMFRKDGVALREWSESNCQLCSERQKRILADIIPSLAKNGHLVYSTCTFNPKENEEIVSWTCETFEMEAVELDFPEDWGITKVEHKGTFGYCFYPHKVKGEGLFIAVMKKKKGLGLMNLTIPKKSKSIQIPSINIEESIIQYGEYYTLETLELKAVKKFISNKLNIIYSGVELGIQKGNNFIPSQALANFYQDLHSFPKVEVDEETALEFLRGNDPKLPLDQKGIHLLTYQNLGLGWLKFLGHRSNNNYPKPWRIKNY